MSGKRYKIGDYKKTGASANIYECDDLNQGQQFIAKSFNNKSNSRSLFNNEKNVLLKLQHEGIVRIFDSYVDLGKPVLIIEKGLFDLTDLLNQQGAIPVQKARKLFLPIFRAVEFMHSLHYVHCDIKPENIIVMNDKSLKIIDFGLCEKFSNQGPRRGRKGTSHYCAPEIITDGIYGFEVDIWALGITLFTVATAQSPFEGDGYNYACNVLSTSPRMYLLREVDREGSLTDLVERMLEKNPKQRPTIKECISHRWFCSENN